MDRDRALSTVDHLYAAATGEAEWSGVLAYVADGLNCRAATLEVHDINERKLAHFDSARIDMANIAKFAREFAWNNPRIRYMLRFASGQVGFDHLMISESEMDRDPFYQELLAPDGLRYFLSAQTPVLDGSKIALLAFHRSGQVRGVDEENLATMRRLEPHIVRALRLYWTRVRDRIDADRFDRLLAKLGLTPAERRLAAALLLGEALPGYARRSRLSVNTIYTHYRRLKAKLECSTQAELLARLHQIAAPSALG